MHKIFKNHFIAYQGITAVQHISKEHLIPLLGDATELINKIKTTANFKAKSGALVLDDYKSEFVVMALENKLILFFKEEMAEVEVESQSSNVTPPKKPKKPKIGIVPVLKIKKGVPIIKNKIRLMIICCGGQCIATCPLFKPKQCNCKKQCPDCSGEMQISDVNLMFDEVVDRM